MRPIVKMDTRVILIILFVLGFWLRVAGLTWGIPDRDNKPSYYHDEGHVLSFVLMGWDEFKKEWGEYEIVRPVLAFRLIGRPLIAMGDFVGINDADTLVYELAAMRVLSAAFGIAGLAAVYALGRQIGGERTGLWALALLTFMPGHWYYSQVLKGDIMVATAFTVILVFAIRIAQRGERWAYTLGALALGVGVALKATTVLAAPILVLGHLWFCWQHKSWKSLINPAVILAVVVGAGSFLVLYPYPFLDWERYRGFIENPSLQHLTFKGMQSPATYVEAWQQYNSPNRPFLEMILGKLLQVVFLPTFIGAIGLAIYDFRRNRRIELAVCIVLTLIFLHSLTFSDALDDRYVLPLAPLAVIFPAVLVARGYGGRRAIVRYAATTLGGLLLVGTAAISWQLFPAFAFQEPREAAIAWVEAQAAPVAIIAQPSQIGRWALPFDPEKFRIASLLYGKSEPRQVAALLAADYVVIQREPWNYDHTFRYEFEGVKEELAHFLGRYERHRVFGKDPQLLGWRIPRNMAMPIIDVYSQPRTEEISLAGLSGGKLPLRPGAALTLELPQQLKVGEYVRVDMEATTIPADEGEPNFHIGWTLHNLREAVALKPPATFEDPSLETEGNRQTLFLPAAAKNFREHTRVSFGMHVATKERAVIYTGKDGALAPVGEVAYRPEYKRLEWQVLLPAGTRQLGELRVTKVATGTLPL